jgi:hypothetical protein
MDWISLEKSSAASEAEARRMLPDLIGWIEDLAMSEYRIGAARPDFVEVTESSFSYIFDLTGERLVLAAGISRGAQTHLRDRNRMRGHPVRQGGEYHRGHSIAHQLGGGLDINLVDQRGNVNIGAFRRLENEAVASPGAFYFCHWIYGPGRNQTPTSVRQGLLRVRPQAELRGPNANAFNIRIATHYN